MILLSKIRSGAADTPRKIAIPPLALQCDPMSKIDQVTEQNVRQTEFRYYFFGTYSVSQKKCRLVEKQP